MAWLKTFFLVAMISMAFVSAAYAAEVDRAVAAKIDSTGSGEKVPVVIRYKEGYNPAAQKAGKALSSAASIMPLAAGFETRREYKEMNAVSGRIDKAALDALKNDPNIASIGYDYQVKIMLQDMLPLINASRTQNATAGGAPVNGNGETICIIDTGINYTHSDLGGCNATSDINNGSCAKVIGGFNYCPDNNCNTTSSNPMDNNGHGTHVAGIAAANGTIRGVAPGARIVMIKALNSAGSGSFTDVEAGIRWCTNNATRLNISVISMSLGTSSPDIYNSSCDGNSSYSSLADAVNNATRHNISVLAAAGNDGSATLISSPGCLANVTAIASSNKTDSVSSFSNRNSLVQLIATGSSINSTSIGGSYTTLSGTSMATPAAAGAFALVRAYERQESGTNMTPAAIRNALNSTGTLISDSGSNRNYSRINILAAISSIDSTLPAANVTSPANATYNSANITLNFTISDNVATGSCWYINATGANVSLASCGNITFTGIEGNNNINVFVNDTNGNTNSTQRFFRIDTTLPQVSIQSPGNTTFSTNNVTLNFIASDAAISSCFYSLNGAANVSLPACGNITLIAASGANNIIAYANDTAGNLNSSQAYFTANITVPIISVQSPSNTTYNTTNISLSYTLAGSIDRCRYLNATGSTVFLNTASGAACSNITFLSREGYNNITIFANNSLGNSTSSQVFFVSDTTAPQITFVSPTPNNEAVNTTALTINATIDDNVSYARVLFNGTTHNLSISGSSWSARLENLTDGNYSFNVTANDTANNTNTSATRWVFINTTRNVTNFTSNLTSALSQNNVSYSILNDTGIVTNNIVDVVNNYTIRFNISGRFADIVNFTWLNANTTAVINVTGNVSTANITAAFNSSGGVLDSVIWIDMNNFTSSFTPRAVFGTNARIFYYINGSRTEPNYTRITAQCDANRTTLPCYEINSTNSLAYLSNFSGAAAGNDTQAPNATISSPTATIYSSTNVTLNYTIADNAAADKCWYVLNSGSNTSLASCGNITFTAAEGTNRLYLYINDTSGNQNSSNMNFTVTLPQASSGGGGGGGGGAAAAPANPNKKSYLFSGTRTIKLNVSSNRTALETIYIETARYMSASLSVEALNATNTTPPGVFYQAVSITPKDFTPAFASAIIVFRVTKAWIAANEVNYTTIKLYRLNQTWTALETRLTRDDTDSYQYSATTVNFSTFAIAGEQQTKEAQPQENTTQNKTTPKICIQVITPATNGMDCVNYPTPCDVPEGWTAVKECPAEKQPGQNQGQDNSLMIAAAAIIVVIVVIGGGLAARK